MSMKLPVAPSDMRGLARLAVEATTGMTDLVEEVHDAVAAAPGSRKLPGPARGRGIKALVYGAIRALTRTVGSGLDGVLSFVPSGPGEAESPAQRDALLAALNGVLGDHLAATGNPLALPMELRYQGRCLELDRARIAEAIPTPGTRILLLVHGLCRNDRQWAQEGHDHGAVLARELGLTPLYLRYNSGLHVSANGKSLAGLLERLLSCWPWPVESLSVLAHSMGGLVARSACHYGAEAGQAWLASLRHLVFLGTPHHGAVLERGGHLLEQVLQASPFTGPFARLGKLRSAGITDLRHGNLLDQDWQGQDRFAHHQDTRVAVPLPTGVRCFAMAATAGKRHGSLQGRLLGDGLVTLDSALGRHRDPRRCLAFPEEQVWIGPGMNHMELLARPEVSDQIVRWLGGGDRGAAAP